MPTRLAATLALLLFSFFSCKKEDPGPNPTGEHFEIFFDNEFNELQARYAAFLSDADGRLRAFRWLPGGDTASLTIPNTLATDRFDCTVVKITNIDASGSGVVDTSIALTTYPGLPSGKTVRLRDSEFRQSLDLIIQFTGISSLDSIIVPDGLTFARPQPANNFTGQYRVLHTGKVWLRLLINGETTWRYMFFDNVSGPSQAAVIDATILPKLFNSPTKTIVLPFTAPWQYKVEGLVDTANLKFMPLGDLLRAPGGAIPVFAQLAVFEPETKPYNGYRLQFAGPVSGSAGYGYALDRYYPTLPPALPEPAFDAQSAQPPNNRYTAALCTGDFDALAFVRTRSGLPNLRWEVLLRPNPGGAATYRLPDLPGEIAGLSFALKTYDFGNAVQIRAEAYDNFSSFEAILDRRLLNDDPYWQTKGGYLGRERNY